MKPGYEAQNFNQAFAQAGEEAAEVAKNVLKAFRYGYFGGNPEIPVAERPSNMELVLNEIADARRAFDVLEHWLKKDYKEFFDAYKSGTLRPKKS